jgi:multicomponent Na+:H+ antiporter subunit E
VNRILRWGQAILERGLILALVWWVVSEGSTIVAWYYAVVVVSAATAVSLWLVAPTHRKRRHPWRLLRFTGWFLWASLRGATDVAVRALAPRPRLDPGVIEYPLRLRDSPTAAVALADVISLLPGTLAVAVHGDRLIVHVLDRGSAVLEGIADAEARIAATVDVQIQL